MSSDSTTEVIHAVGVNGQIAFNGRTINITRDGVGGRIAHGRQTKAIPVRQVAGVQYKPNSWTGTRGYLALTIPGADEGTRKHYDGTRQAFADENAVVFKRSQQADFERLRDAILAAM